MARSAQAPKERITQNPSIHGQGSARMASPDLDRLKREVSVERLAQARGVKLVRKGKDLHGRCPWHDDREASLVISPEKNLWHCLGACNQGGSVIDWVMKAEGVSFRHAVELLRADLPSLAAAGGPGALPIRPVKATTVRKLPGLLDADADDQVLLRRVVDYYCETLKQSPEALGYLQSRGLEGAEMVERFRLGYSNRTLGYRLESKNRLEGGKLRSRLQALGVLRESGHEHLRGSLVIPIFDAQGRVVQMYGRKIRTDLRKGTVDHLYLPSPLRGVWNLAAVQESREVILCEALLDALSFWGAGFRNVTTAYGVNGLTEDHWQAFRAHKTERVLIAFDRDDAGERAAVEVARQLMDAGIAAYRIQFPRGMDANAYACKVRPAARSLALLIRSAVWLGQGKAPALTTQRVEAAAGPSAPLTAPTAPVEPVPPPVPIAPSEEAAKGGSPAEGPPRTAPEPPAPVPAVEPAAEPAPTQALPPPLPLAEIPADRGPAAAPATLPPLQAPPIAPPPSDPPLVARVPALASPVPVERRGEELWLRLGDRVYRVRGLEKNLTQAVLKVNVLVSREGAGFHVDTLDLYIARQRDAFAREAAAELGLEDEAMRRDLGRVILALESAQDEDSRRRQEPTSKVNPMAEADRDAALALLKAPDLLDQVLADFTRCGVVGEETNKLVGYLAAVSRKLDAPLAVVIQSSSAAGKSSLMDAVLALMPEEERVAYSAMTGQSLFYMGETNLAHKILAIVEEEGAQRASYALKLLQSEGELTIASTGKDPTTGRLVTHEYKVEGPVMIFLTTTAIQMDEELLNRCLVLTVDEGREQTRAIHQLQRRRQTLEGLLKDQARTKILKRHRDAQRLLRPLLVANPFAEELTFLDHQTRTRRDHMKYLTLIRAIALLHQYQREVKTAEVEGTTVSYVEVTRADIAVANRLAHEVLGRSLDELPPQTRRLLGALVAMVEEKSRAQGLAREDYRFTRRDVREWTGLGDTQVRLHLERLEALEYLLVHAAPRGQSRVYELLYRGDATCSAPLLPGLLDAGALHDPGTKPNAYDQTLSDSSPDPAGETGGVAGAKRAECGGDAGGVRTSPATPESGSPSEEEDDEEAEIQDPDEIARTGTGGASRVVPLPASYRRRGRGPGR